MASFSVMADVPNPIFDSNGNPFSGAVLKAFLPGTTTSTSIAIDSSGSSPQTSITYNAQGKLEVTGNEILPYIDRKHKWGIFANATDAAANTPFYMGPFDNVEKVLDDISTDKFVKSFLTLQGGPATTSAVENTSVVDGDTVRTLEFISGNKGGGLYKVVLTSSVTPNAANFVVGVADATITFVLQIDNVIDLAQFNVTTATADNQTNINIALLLGGEITGPPGTYLTTNFDVVSNTHLYGPRSLIFKLVNNSDVDLLDVGSSSNVHLEGFTLDGNKANQTTDFDAVVVRGDGCSDVTIEHIKNINSTLTGINIRNDFRTKVLYGLVNDSGVENSVNSGDAMFFQNSTDLRVEGTGVNNCARIAVVLKGTVDVDSKINIGARIINVTARNTGENAFSSEDGVEDFTFETCKAFVTGTSAFASTRSGFAVGERSIDGTLTNCDAHDTPSQGFELTNGVTKITLENPKSYRAGTAGIQNSASEALGGSTDITIINPLIEDPALDGIVITAAPTNPILAANINTGIKIDGGVIRNAGRDGFVGSSMDDWSIVNLEVNTPGTGAGIRWINSINGQVTDPLVVKAGNRGLYNQGTLISNNDNHVSGGVLLSCGTFGYFQTNANLCSVRGLVVRNKSGDTDTVSGIRAEGTGGNNIFANNDATTISTQFSSTNPTDVFFNNDQKATRSSITGSPEGVVTAIIGSTITRLDGGASTTFYVKESGTGNIGWVAK